MEKIVANFPDTTNAAQDATTRARLYAELEIAVKELVNLLVPSEVMLNKACAEGLMSEDSNHVTIRRDELESVTHLVGHARVVADRLRDIMRAAKINVEEPRLRDAPRPRDEVRVRDESRPRDDSWRKEPREALRTVKSA
jgi:hypothetical protein